MKCCYMTPVGSPIAIVVRTFILHMSLLTLMSDGQYNVLSLCRQGVELN